MTIKLLKLSLGAFAIAMFAAPAQAAYKWEGGRWVLRQPCSLGQAIWCASHSNCVGGAGCNFAMSTASQGSNNTELILPGGKKVYVPKGTKEIAPTPAEQATKK